MLNIQKSLYLEDGSILETTNIENYSVSNQIKDPSFMEYQEVKKILIFPKIKRYTKVFLLHPDETIYKDISSFVSATGNIEKNSQDGQRRSSSLTFINPEVYKKIVDDYQKYGTLNSKPESMWNPFQRDNELHNNIKIKLVSCIDFYNIHYEINEGIFIAFDPKMMENAANKTLSIQLYDKFANLDGTIDGKGELDYEIPVNTLVYDALNQLLKLSKNNRGEPYDFKDIIFPAKYRKELLAYTIKKTSENSIGDLIKDIVASIACTVGYNVDGHLVVSDVLDDMDFHNRIYAWEYSSDESQYQNPSIDIKWSQIKNKVIVVGANVNGYLCKGVAENRNPISLYNINSDFGIKSIKITDNLIPSNKMCEERAKYELKKYARNYITLSFQSIWIPFLEPGDIIVWTKKDWGIYKKEFVINSISLPLNGKDPMSITATSLDEISS